MPSLALFEPEIPPNTGNVARLCAATDTPLHLIEPLGFSIDDKHLKRAGLDYWPHVRLHVWPGWDEFAAGIGVSCPGARIVPTSARQGKAVHEFVFQPDDVLLLGPETRGLPKEVHDAHPQCVRIPICGHVRSLNLSTAAGIVLYAALAGTGELDRWATSSSNTP
ncbi:MAG: tRNA (cytidine(34)-2'-O)-methyltransferase [Desulfovibrio sp.]|nr:MAG: tRNA (cytidine(34)-2'-O)-methyltransferase [Desulfovibrio sp.]